MQVDLQDITLLEQAGRDSLINFANSGIGQIDYSAYLAEVMYVCVCVLSLCVIYKYMWVHTPKRSFLRVQTCFV